MSDALMSCERFRGAVEAALDRFEADLAASTAGRPAPRPVEQPEGTLKCPYCGGLIPERAT